MVQPETAAVLGVSEAQAMRLDDFMRNANARYYATRDPFADFTTAPEICQVFGELLGAWAAGVWHAMGEPGAIMLAEAGPGRGTLMQDALRVIRRVAPGFAAAISVHFIETSSRLREAQKARVANAHWHERFENLPPGPLIVLANEFLDALPIRQFVRRDGAWRERFVSGGQFIECASEDLDFDASDGTVVEMSGEAMAWVTSVAARICQFSGAALIVDYGNAEPAFGNSLQALRGGKPADPLDQPGMADLTAHVDFAALANSAHDLGARVHGPVEQGCFLERLGIQLRLEKLCAANAGQEKALRDSVDRLVSPTRMGSLFKAMAISSSGLLALPGFSP